MFEVTTTLRTFYVQADTFNLAVLSAYQFILDDESILGIKTDGPATFIIVEIAA